MLPLCLSRCGEQLEVPANAVRVDLNVQSATRPAARRKRPPLLVWGVNSIVVACPTTAPRYISNSEPRDQTASSIRSKADHYNNQSGIFSSSCSICSKATVDVDTS